MKCYIKISVKEYQIMVFLKWKKIILNVPILFLRTLKKSSTVMCFLVCYLFNVIDFGFSYDSISDH